MSTFRLALIQLAVGSSKSENLLNAFQKIKQAASAGAKMVALPECFNSPYGIQHFPAYAEKIPSGETATKLSEWAKEFGLYIIGGSIPETEEGNKLYNTCTVWNPKGELIALHRKMHLFDISIPGKITFEESKVLSPGKKFTTFDTDYCKVGVGICYDIRFAEMAQVYREKGCKLLVYPGAFNMTTGPAHWKILQQARALDNQVFVATCSPARDESAGYVAWGHSMVVDPWANVLVEASEKEEIVYMDIDLSKLEEIREQIPMTKQRRSDIYHVTTSEEK